MNKKYIVLLLMLVVVWMTGCGAAQNNSDSDASNESKPSAENVQILDNSSDPSTEDNNGEDNGDGNETEIPENIAYVLRRLETLKPEDIESFDTMPADAEVLVPLIHAAAESYTTDYISDNMGEWRLLLELSENPEDPALSSERFILAIDTREGIVDVTYREDAEADPSDFVDIRLYSEELWSYIFSLYNRDGIDLEALANFEDILSARAQQTMEYHNTTMVERGYPAFTGFEIDYLRLIDSFSYGIYYYQIYRWDAAFLTDDPDPSRYAWYQNQYVDEQNRIGNYEWCIYFVAAWVHDDLEYEFYNDDLYHFSFSRLRAHATIIEDFDDTKIYLEGTDGDNGDVVYTRDGVSISIPDDFHLQIKVCDNPDTWRYGMVMNPVYYLDNPYMTDQTLFSLFHSCEYVNDGCGLIFSIRRYTEEEYKYYYLNSYSRQQVFARDENYYYCVFIPTGASQNDSETAEKLAALLERQLDKILADMIERNDWTPLGDFAER